MCSILIIAEEPQRIETLVNFLPSALAGNILTAYSGTEALAVLRHQPVDLITLEPHLQIMDRFSLPGYVRKRYPTLPMIILLPDADTPSPLLADSTTIALSLPLDVACYQSSIQQFLAPCAHNADPLQSWSHPPNPAITLVAHHPANDLMDPSNGESASTLASLRTPERYERKDVSMTTIQQTLNEAMNIDGALGAALVDYHSGMALGTVGGSPTLNLEVAAAGNTDVVRAKMKVMEALGLKDRIEDILITLSTQYHIIRILPASEGLFLYLMLNKKQANLALARHKLAQLESTLTI